jgi:hypothetical protein
VIRPEATTENGNSVIVWKKSSYCADSQCVEVADIGDDAVGIRDSKRLDQPFLRFDRAEFSAFLAGVKAGDFSVRQ